MAGQVDKLSFAQTRLGDIFAVQEHDPPPLMDAAVAIIQPVDCRVVLIVRADRHHQEFTGRQPLADQAVNLEFSLAAASSEIPIPGAVRQTESARNAHATVVILASGNHRGDVIADAAVFLLSARARFMTGCILPVSGGAELGYRR